MKELDQFRSLSQENYKEISLMKIKLQDISRASCVKCHNVETQRAPEIRLQVVKVNESEANHADEGNNIEKRKLTRQEVK